MSGWISESKCVTIWAQLSTDSRKVDVSSLSSSIVKSSEDQESLKLQKRQRTSPCAMQTGSLLNALTPSFLGLYRKSVLRHFPDEARDLF